MMNRMALFFNVIYRWLLIFISVAHRFPQGSFLNKISAIGIEAGTGLRLRPCARMSG
jgi:hypothetical protein